MSYATDFHLLDVHGATQWSGFNRQLKQTLAASVAFHVVIFVGLLSLRISPVLDRPLASYQIELVDLSAPKVAPPPVPAPQKKSPPPPTPAVTQPAEPTPPVPVPQEHLAETIAGALKQVTLPEARPIPAPSTTPSPAAEVPVPSPVQDLPLNLQAPPEAPQLTTRDRPSVGSKSNAPSSQKAGSLAKSLQQAVESVPIPPSTHRSREAVPSETKAASSKVSKKKETLSASKSISLPAEAPKLAESTPVNKIPDSATNRVKKKPLSESLQQAVRSVVIPDMKAGKVPPKVPSTKSPVVTTPQESPVMPKIVLPPQAPQLASVESPVKSSQSTNRESLPQAVPTDRDELGSRIAKLTIPDVDVSQPRETLKEAASNDVKTKTNLKVAGSSPDGNPYWGRVWAKIDQEWVAPPVTVHQGNVLQVILEFRLERTGTVKHLTIRQTSGNEYYDLAAKRAVLAAAPLPGFPPDMTESQFTLQFQFTVNER